jgi:hypothetical protein
MPISWCPFTTLQIWRTGLAPAPRPTGRATALGSSRTRRDGADPADGAGPGTAPQPAYAKAIKDCYRYGRASVIGYVWTNYGRDGAAGIPAIEKQIDSYYSFYPGGIAGIFFDGVSDATPETMVSNQAFYQTLASYVHARSDNNDEVGFNFGANPGSDWMMRASSARNADIVVTFEGSYDDPNANPFTAWQQPAWEQRYPAGDFAALVNEAPDTACTRNLRLPAAA